MNITPIEWTTFSANPIKYRNPEGAVVWGCVKTSPGCAHCYSEGIAQRFTRGGPFTAPTMATLTPFLDEAECHKMLTAGVIKGVPVSGSRCFVGDMTDIFGEWVPDGLLDRLFAVFALRQDVTFQILTKRPARMRDYLNAVSEPWGERRSGIEVAMYEFGGDDDARTIAHDDWPLRNLWLGASVENQHFADERIPLLLQTPAAVRFISAEPLLGPIDLREHLNGDSTGHETNGPAGWQTGAALDWVIVGGESGHGARPFDVAWARSIVAQCKAAGVPVFVKQLGARPIAASVEGACEHEANPCEHCDSHIITLRDKKGGDMSEFPLDLRVREFPAGAAGSDPR